MSAKAARGVVPKLVVFHSTAAHGAEYYAAGLPGGYRLGAEFHWGKLYKVALFDLNAKYPEKIAVPYPAPPGGQATRSTIRTSSSWCSHR